ncbi:alcohol dehydrogenase 1-like isoform X2 [Nerophis ophidion]|uniref:alcohol dehydrogenase 1-like isoform X2 n=1 Tax=Nerophis ophidion TaxID=159077 RepID=UPI002AE063BE|nr:alcohol dehydrogenase 1-like isoform X2 [Nerophis ophidion]
MSMAGKVIKCKAAVAWEPNKPLVIEEIEVDPPQANEVRVKIVATGLCRTDLYYLYDSDNTKIFPMVLGHEGAGIVESVGAKVTEFQPGDKVIPLIISQCRECRFCKSPKTNQCENAWDVVPHNVEKAPVSKLNCNGKKLLQFMGISTFSEYSVINQIALAKIDPAAPLDKVCLLGCGVCTGFGAAVNDAKVEPGSTCAVFGLGAVGLAAIMGCKYAGAKRIIAVDVNANKFKKAEEFGATDCVNPKDQSKTISQVISEMTNGGVDYSLECVGDVELMLPSTPVRHWRQDTLGQTPPTIRRVQPDHGRRCSRRHALESCLQGWGVSVIVGWTDRHDVSVRPGQLIAGRTWKGSVFGDLIGGLLQRWLSFWKVLLSPQRNAVALTE